MSLSLDLVYIVPKLRVVYTTCLSEKNIQDLLQTGSPEEFFDVLKETSYYQYVKGVSPRDLLSFELSLDTHLYNLSVSLGRVGGDIWYLVDALRKISITKIFSIVVKTALSRDIEGIKRIRGIVPVEVRGLLEEIISEEPSIHKILEKIEARGLLEFSRHYRELSRYMGPELSSILATDLSILDMLLDISDSYPETSDLVCLERDFYILNLLSRVVSIGLQERLSSYSRRLYTYSCTLPREVLEEMMVSDETRFLTLARRLYPGVLSVQDMASLMISVRGLVRRGIRRRAVSYMSSYPFTYTLLWSLYTLKRLDIEDLVAILSSKIGRVSIDTTRRLLSI